MQVIEGPAFTLWADDDGYGAVRLPVDLLPSDLRRARMAADSIGCDITGIGERWLRTGRYYMFEVVPVRTECSTA